MKEIGRMKEIKQERERYRKKMKDKKEKSEWEKIKETNVAMKINVHLNR